MSIIQKVVDGVTGNHGNRRGHNNYVKPRLEELENRISPSVDLTSFQSNVQDGSGNTWIISPVNKIVSESNPAGQGIGTFTTGTDLTPVGVEIDSSGNILIASQGGGNTVISELNSSGNLIEVYNVQPTPSNSSSSSAAATSSSGSPTQAQALQLISVITQLTQMTQAGTISQQTGQTVVSDLSAGVSLADTLQQNGLSLSSAGTLQVQPTANNGSGSAQPPATTSNGQSNTNSTSGADSNSISSGVPFSDLSPAQQAQVINQINDITLVAQWAAEGKITAQDGPQVLQKVLQGEDPQTALQEVQISQAQQQVAQEVSQILSASGLQPYLNFFSNLLTGVEELVGREISFLSGIVQDDLRFADPYLTPFKNLAAYEQAQVAAIDQSIINFFETAPAGMTAFFSTNASTFNKVKL